MFSLARGKVGESTARLALAEGMMKVSAWSSLIPSPGINAPLQSMHKYAADVAPDLPNQRLAEKVRNISSMHTCMVLTPAQLGVPVCNALLAFGQEKYDEVTTPSL